MAGLTFGATALASAATITLNTLADSELVGQNDPGGATAPAAPGSGWYTSTNAGEVRQRATGNQENLRTQWYFRFDTAALAGISSGDILSATISIPQIGRLNTLNGSAPLELSDTNLVWNTSTAHPAWNAGRAAPTGSGTLIQSWADAADTFWDSSRPD